MKDAPAGVRGSVYSLKAGEYISYDEDLGPGWKQLIAQRRGGELRLYVAGRLIAKSAPFKSEEFELSTDQQLRIGFGEQDYFTGRIREVRLYRRALTEREIQMLQKDRD